MPSVSGVSAPHQGANPDPKRLRPFSQVSLNLLSLGAIPLETFVRSPSFEHEEFRFPTPPPLETPVEDEQKGPLQAIQTLHQTCQRVFGNGDALKYEFLEDFNKKRCILTVTRPNGLSRSYTTKAEFSRKSDAKAKAAQIAIDMGVVDFISNGDNDLFSRSGGLVLAPLDAPPRKVKHINDLPKEIKPPGLVFSDDESPAVQQIAECCREWRARQVKPQYITTSDTKDPSLHGCALKIELSPHSMRVYSVPNEFETHVDAKNAVAKLAIEQDVIEFIKHGNGQVEPLIDTAPQTRESPPPPAPMTMTLQAFFNSLPKPLPDEVGIGPAGQNAVGWLNQVVQQCRGSRLQTHFNYLFQTHNGLRLHGCLLRLSNNLGESRSYLVDCMFTKRAEAKTAACLQAVSQGVGTYIRKINEHIDKKLTSDMKKAALEQYLPSINTELSRAAFGVQPMFEWTYDHGAFTCTLTIEMASDVVRKYTVPAEYRSKNDAKCAALCLAMEQKVIDFIRFRGKSPPPGYDPATYTGDMAEGAGKKAKKAKKKQAEAEAKAQANSSTNSGEATTQSQTQPPVKKIDSATRNGIPLLETKEEAMARTKKAWGKSNPGKGNWNARPTAHATSSVPPPAQAHPGYGHPYDDTSDVYPTRAGYASSLDRLPPEPHVPPGVWADPRRGGGVHMSPSPPPTRTTVSDPYYHSGTLSSYPGAHIDSVSARYHSSYDSAHRPYSDAPTAPYYGHPPPLVPPPPSHVYSGYHNSPPPPPPHPYYPPYPAHPGYPPSSHAHDPSYEAWRRDYSYPSYSAPPSHAGPSHAGPPHPPPIASTHVHGPPQDPYASHPRPVDLYYAPYERDRYELERERALADDRDREHGYGEREYERKRSHEHDRGRGPKRDRERERPRPVPHRLPPRRDPDSLADLDLDPGVLRSPPFSPLTPPSHVRALQDRNRSPVPSKEYDIKGFSTQAQTKDGLATPARSAGSTSGSRRSPTPEINKHGKRPRLSSPTPALAPPPGKSYMAMLLDHCAKAETARPEFDSQTIETDQGVRFKVWVIMGKEKLELPTTFASLKEGQDRLSKQVLSRLRASAKKQKVEGP